MTKGKRSLRLLLVEDNSMDAELIEATLKSEFDLELRLVTTEVSFREALKNWTPDLIISDYTLPCYNGKGALAAARELRPEIPFMFFSGTIGEEAAIESMKAGAMDYVLKEHPGRLLTAIGRALDEADARRSHERDARKIKAQANMLNHARDAIMVFDLKGVIRFWNRGAQRIFGYAPEEVEGLGILEVIPPAAMDQFEAARKQTLQSGFWEGSFERRAKDGRFVTVASHWTLAPWEDGPRDHILSINTDITEKIQLEKQFLRAQRLESIGTLASGIAHDLNNILAPILMASEILQEENLRPDAAAMLQTIQTSAVRGAEIVKQVLTFVRGSEGKRVPLNLEYLLREIWKVASETFPRNIRIKCVVPRDLKPVCGDATQLHQVLMNLCVNARDAMPAGGHLTLSAQNISGEQSGSVLLIVEDSGQGIPPDIQEKIFDPFFTTKDPGKGTGLGLSTVVGIVKSHGGTIKVDSTPGKGTTFEILLPAHEDGASDQPASTAATPVPRGAGELVLVVDDEAEVRKTIRWALEQNGYEVVTAENGSSAIIQFTTHKSIKLVVADVMMPGADGQSLASAIRALKSDVRFVITSGLPCETELPSGTHFLQKPVATDDLLRAVNAALHS